MDNTDPACSSASRVTTRNLVNQDPRQYQNCSTFSSHITIFDRSNIMREGGVAGGPDPTPFFITQEQRASRKMYFLITHVTVREFHSVMVEVVNC